MSAHRAKLRYGRPLPCDQLCMPSGEQTLANGYQWSLCPNIGVFQRLGASAEDRANDTETRSPLCAP